jgi:hypothetical protein
MAASYAEHTALSDVGEQRSALVARFYHRIAPPERRSIAASVKTLLFLLFSSFFLPHFAFAASVTNVTSTSNDGSYRAGTTITIDVSFSEVVIVTGTPQLRLETGASDAIINYSGGSGSTTLRFSYTVTSGHTTSDLDYQSTAALTLNGGSISNSANSAAALTLPEPGSAGSLGANKNIAVDTSPPIVTLTSVTPLTTNTQPLRVQVTFSENVTGFSALDPTVINGEVSGFSGTGNSYSLEITPYLEGNVTVQIAASVAFDGAMNGNNASSVLTIRYDTTPPTVTRVLGSPASGAYRAGLSANVIVEFAEAVTVTGIPSFTVETGSSDGIASYLSGSGTSQLTFRYTVQAGQNSTDLDYTAQDALVLNGGTIRDAASNAANLTLPTPGTSTSLSGTSNIIIDTILPDVTISSTVSGETSLDAIPVTVVFSEPMTGFALSDFAVTNGCASNLRGSGTTYYADIVPRAHGTVTIAIPGAVAVDVAGNPNTAAPSPVSVTFFTFGPKVTSVTSSTPDGAYRAGQMVSIQVSFSDPVTVTGTPQLRLATGSPATVNYSSGSGSDTLTFEYTIAAGQNSNDLDYVPLPPLTLSGGQIRDLATNSFDAALTFACPGSSGSLAHSKNLIVDTIAPTISRVTSTTPNGAYRAGLTLNVRTLFSENVFVTGIPTLTLETGPSDAVISMVAGSGSTNLDFSYTVVDGHNSNRLDYTSASAFNFNGATIVDHAGNIAVITLPAPGSTNSLFGQKSLVVDTVPPIVPNVTSSTANGSYKAGSMLNVQVAFSETIYVTGAPRLALAAGVPNRFASYSSGNASTTLTFSYTVGTGDTASDLDYISATALDPNGGSLRDLAGNEAITLLAQPGAQFSLGFNKNIQLDTTTPSILSVSSATPSGAYSIGTTIPIVVSFSEPVNVAGAPYIVLNTLPSQATAAYLSGSGTSMLTFAYTVGAGQNTSNLDYTATTALVIPVGATIRDAATNDTISGLPAPGVVGSLSAQALRIIDTTLPTITTISFATADGSYRAGYPIDVDVSFSENISLTGTLQLHLATGSLAGRASCSSLISPSTLRCSYLVQPGDNSLDLDYQSSTALTLAPPASVLVDIAGNSAVLTLPNPGAPTSLAGQGSITLDTVSPTAILSSLTQLTTNLNPIPVSVVFSEPVTGLSLDDFTATNGALQNLSGAGTSYTAELVPHDDGAVILELRGTAVVDAAGNSNGAPPLFQRTYDSTRPTVRVDSSAVQTSNTSSIPATVTFSEAVTGFTVSDISVTNGTVSSFSGSGTTYSLHVHPSTDGAVELFIPENVALDAGGNGNFSSDTLSRLYDSTAPEVISVRSTTANGHYRAGTTITIQVRFSEPIFVTGSPRLTLATGTSPGVATYVDGDGTETLRFTYTVVAGDASPDLDYTAITALQLSSSTIRDLATNSALAILPQPGSPASLSGQQQIIIDTQAPNSPEISVPASDSIINRAHVEIQGLAEARSSVSIHNTTLQELCTTTASEEGLWSCTLANLDDGAYQVTAVSEDLAGNSSTPSSQVRFVVDLLALDAPIFTEPVDGMTTETTPVFAGTAPANKQVRLRNGSNTICTTAVTSSGTWSCPSTVALPPGRYDITGTTEDPGDLTTSSATPFSLTVGTRLTGIILHANRDLTPCRDVEVSDSALSTKSNDAGVFSLIVPDPADPKLTLSKFGWQIERSDTLSERASQAGAHVQWLAVPALERETYTVWHGGLGDLAQRIRVLNKSSDTKTATVTLFKSDGTACSEMFTTDIAARTTTSVNLNQNSCFQPDSYGVVKVTFPSREYDATLISHHDTGGLDRYLVSHNELPLANTTTGKSYTFFDNAYHQVRRSTESFSLRNDLVVANPSQIPQSFTVRRYRSTGTLTKTWRFTLPPMGSYMVPFIEADETTPQNGIQEVEPDDIRAPYVAVMVRSGEQQHLTPRKKGRFIYMNYTESGAGNTRFARVRYLAQRRAIQYAEVANITGAAVNARIKRIGSSGKAKPTIPLHLAPYETRKVRLSRLLEKFEEGVAEISSDTPDSLMVATVMKHYRPDNKLLSMKSLPIKETFGDSVYGSYSSQRRTNSVLKISNLGLDTGSATVMCYSNDLLIDAQTLSLAPGQLREVYLPKCFNGTSSGVVEVNSSKPGTMVVDLLRFRSREDIHLAQRLR